jgi:hypothetical protein
MNRSMFCQNMHITYNVMKDSKDMNLGDFRSQMICTVSCFFWQDFQMLDQCVARQQTERER